jgi:hypothetical protein
MRYRYSIYGLYRYLCIDLPVIPALHIESDKIFPLKRCAEQRHSLHAFTAPFHTLRLQDPEQGGNKILNKSMNKGMTIFNHSKRLRLLDPDQGIKRILNNQQAWLSSAIPSAEDQGCGSGLFPDSVTLWIRIRIGNSDPASGSRAKKIKKFQWKNALFSYLKKNLPVKRYKIALTTFFKFLMNNTGFLFDLTQFWFPKKFEKELSSKVLF